MINETYNTKGRRNLPAIFILFFTIILFSFSVNADYQIIGNDGTFNLDDGDFNTGVTASVTGSQVLSNDVNTPPLIADLDGGLYTEIIGLDGKVLTVYQNKTLDVADGTILPSTSSVLSNMIVFDIDGDGEKEIIIASGDLEIYIYGFNESTGLTLEHNNAVTFAPYSGGSLMIACRDTNECLLIANDEDTRTSTDFRAITFSSSSGTHSSVNIETPTSTSEFTCFPRIPQIQTGELNDFGDKEYIVSYVYVNIAGSEILKVASIWVNNTDPTDLAVNWKYTLITNGFANDQSCTVGNYENLISSPLVYDFDKTNGDIEETVVAYQVGANDYNMKVIDPSGVLIDTYPAIFDADGVILSNPFLANSDTTTGLEDFCVVGGDLPENRLSILCSSLESTQPGSNAFEYRFNTPYNYSLRDKSWEIMSHSVEVTDGDTQTEILTMYGILNTDEETCNILNVCDANLLYQMPKINGTAIMGVVDDERSDIILQTPTNLWYIDDGFTNLGGQITYYTINPCIDSVWKINTTVQITVTVEDDVGDQVSARAVLYEGDANEQDSGWSVNASSGTSFTFGFNANKTITNGRIKLYARDTNDPNNDDIIERTFSVANNGVSYGECITEVEIDLVTTVTDITTSDKNDSITNAINDIEGVTGAGFEKGVWWLLFMTVVAVGIWAKGEDYADKTAVLGVIGITEIILFIIGLKLKFFGVGTLIIVIVLALALLSFKWSPFRIGGN